MTGAEHYAEAERLLLSCQVMPATEGDPATYPSVEEGEHTTGNALAAAQIHATLALAAAVAYPVERQGESGSWTGYGGAA